MVDDILGMLKAHKTVYDWDSDARGESFRPFRPAYDVLEGETPAELDAAFINALAEKELKIVTETLETLEQAQAARDELLELDLMTLPIGFALPR